MISSFIGKKFLVRIVYEMKCEVCGSELSKSQKYCGVCGNPVVLYENVKPVKLTAPVDYKQNYQQNVSQQTSQPVNAATGVVKAINPKASKKARNNSNVSKKQFGNVPKMVHSFIAINIVI